jgi:hypothetical protein
VIPLVAKLQKDGLPTTEKDTLHQTKNLPAFTEVKFLIKYWRNPAALA